MFSLAGRNRAMISAPALCSRMHCTVVLFRGGEILVPHHYFQSLCRHSGVDQPLSQSSTNFMSTRILDAMLSSRVFHLNHNVSFLANQPDDPTDSILRHSVGVMPQAVSRLPIRMAAKPFPHGHKSCLDTQTAAPNESLDVSP
jgi:hypothetical protein